VLATLVRLLGNLDLAEESMREAFAAALESWPQTGIPDEPRPWLISTARFKAIDAMPKPKKARRHSHHRGAGYESCCTADVSASGDDVWQHVRDPASRGLERAYEGE
jgi:predicted RNA polymerase sigma factor